MFRFSNDLKLALTNSIAVNLGLILSIDLVIRLKFSLCFFVMSKS